MGRVTQAAFDLLRSCELAIAAGVPTDKTPDDKEFHFQRWVADRIRDAGYDCTGHGRNTYPDLLISGQGVAVEANEIISEYRENLSEHTLTPLKAPNPTAGRMHSFRAWRTDSGPTNAVELMDDPNVELVDLES